MNPATLLMCLLLAGCRHVDLDPVYSVVPPRIDVIDVEEPPEFTFRYPPPPDEDLVIEQFVTTNGVHILIGFPEIDNFEEVSNYWYAHGVDSYYVSNRIIYRHR